MTLTEVKLTSPSHYAHGQQEPSPSAQQHLSDKELAALCCHRQFCETTTPYRDAVVSTSKIVEVPPTPPTIEGTQSFADSFTAEIERTKELRKCQKRAARGKGKGKGKGKALPKSKETVDSDSGADSYDSEMYPEVAAAQNAVAEANMVSTTLSPPPYHWLRRWDFNTTPTQYAPLGSRILRARSPLHIPGVPTAEAPEFFPGGVPCYLRHFVDPTGFGEDEIDNNPDSYAYDNFGYRRLVSTYSSFSALSIDEHQQLLKALSSLENRVDLINIHSTCCSKCKKVRDTKDIDFLADSGTSLSFTHSRSNVSEFEVIYDKMKVQTASKDSQLQIVGKGSVFFSHLVEDKGRVSKRISCLYPVFYIPGLSVRLLSVGSLLNTGLKLKGTSNSLEFTANETNQIELVCKPHQPGQTIYWLAACLVPPQSLLAKSMVLSVDYDIMHRRFAHPSKDVL